MANPRSQTLVPDPLFVAVTRPAMAFGVPYAALLCTAVLSVESFLLSRNILALGLCAPLFGIARLLCSSDPRYFEICLLWVSCRVYAPGSGKAWGARTLDPIASRSVWVCPC